MYSSIESDEILIKRVKNGDCEAFNPLVERYKLALYKLMYRMVYNRDDAEDLVEEAFIKAYRSISRFEIGRPFYAWLSRLAVNNAINFLRKKKRGHLEPLEWSEHRLVAEKQNPVAMTREKMLKERINKAMAQLPQEYRTILVLRVNDELSYEEISEVLKIPKGTVMSRLARARQRLKEIFKEMEVHKHEM
ncbi:MAG: sigma-70 family RNA polymerase sigma factor [candidate division WOR-3 bacterium]|nr:MAG: sigma-70 family RNA polymerase sigma factor [candidate division WOR-3 bacterium]